MIKTDQFYLGAIRRKGIRVSSSIALRKGRKLDLYSMGIPCWSSHFHDVQVLFQMGRLRYAMEWEILGSEKPD